MLEKNEIKNQIKELKQMKKNAIKGSQEEKTIDFSIQRLKEALKYKK